METNTVLAAPAHDVLLTAEDFWGPQRACIAMMMQRAGLIRSGVPEPCHVSAFSRQDTADEADLYTALGAARSFGEQNMEVRFIGRPSEVASHRYSGWIQGLKGHHHFQAEFDRNPEEKDVKFLVEDPLGPWLIKLDAAPEAFGNSSVAFQPTLVVDAHNDQLTVHNPGNAAAGIEARAFQTLKITQALGAIANKYSHVSLMAVRPLISNLRGLTILPSPNIA